MRGTGWWTLHRDRLALCSRRQRMRASDGAGSIHQERRLARRTATLMGQITPVTVEHVAPLRGRIILPGHVQLLVAESLRGAMDAKQDRQRGVADANRGARAVDHRETGEVEVIEQPAEVSHPVVIAVDDDLKGDARHVPKTASTYM